MGPIPALQLNLFLRYKQNKVNFKPKMTILSQKTAYNMTINGRNWKNYTRFKNLRQRAFIWDQSQLCSSFHSQDISKTWIWDKNGHLVTKKLFIMWKIIDWNWKNYKRSGNLKQRALSWDQSQLCSSISSWDISKTTWIMVPKMAKMISFFKNLLIMWLQLNKNG